MRYCLERDYHCFFIRDAHGEVVESFDFNERAEAKRRLEELEKGLSLDNLAIGTRVVYHAVGKRQHGTVTSKNKVYAFVRYDGTHQPVATKPEYLVKEG